MAALSVSRSRLGGLAAAAGTLSLLGGVAALALPAAASVRPPFVASGPQAPGNNGTIKIEGVDIQSGPPDNNPHQGCSFVVEFYNYDEGDLSASVEFDDRPPTGNVGLKVESGDLTPFIGGDAAGGGNDLDAKVTYTLSFTGQPHPQQGYHVKITIHADGSKGADVKHKTFWVEGCTPPTTPPTTTPPTTTKPPTTKPPTTAPPTTTKPPTTAPPTTKPPTKAPSSHPTSRHTTTSAPVVTTSEEPTTGVPTAVDAGLGSDPNGGAADSSQFALLGSGLLVAGGLMLAAGAAIVLRRRGRHSS